jgi:hypothetical protein
MHLTYVDRRQRKKYLLVNQQNKKKWNSFRDAYEKVEHVILALLVILILRVLVIAVVVLVVAC